MHSSGPTWRQFRLKRRSAGFQSHLMNTFLSGVRKHMNGETGLDARNGLSSKSPVLLVAVFLPFAFLAAALRAFLTMAQSSFEKKSCDQLPCVPKRVANRNPNF